MLKEVFIVKHYDIYDNEHTEFIIGVGNTYDEAVNIIKDEIKSVAASYSCCRYSIEKWDVNKRYAGGLETRFTKEDNIKWAKELGVYYEEG